VTGIGPKAQGKRLMRLGLIGESSNDKLGGGPRRLPADDPATEALIPLIHTSCDVAFIAVAGVATPLMSSHSASTTWNTRAGSH
jgi:hypothetical protein